MSHPETSKSTHVEVATGDTGQARWLLIYEQMLTIRLFEEHVNQLYLTAKMPGLAHLYSGEEAIAVGVCQALRRDDYITSTHRGHGHCLAKGATVDLMFAELLGKEPGYCHGKGGSMHIADQDTGNLGANAIVGGSAGIATGAAMSSKMRGSDQVAVCFFGDGALGQGLLYEVMNMAALWQFPVIYVCENNLYNEYTHNSETTAGDMGTRAKAFGIPVEEVDGQDVRAVYAAAQRLVARARRGEGPGFLLCHTYRYFGHHVGDIQRAYYRSKEEEERWTRDHDPLKILADWLIAEEHVTPATFAQIKSRVQAEVEAGEQFALNAPYPDPSEVDQHVYA
ncbi:MAG TPA: thiamine pyrophosphate-dependent dehydrogenase E1 component subunit alpha [Ktedonobacteraceae bacterium]|jgi:pyruvate dehydrogenase E1 component alpha subunit|nr:thiamine pyrophosphate-dependent dehydrogenase E1 component subunit alpha [Ktedonobacteraceae bacterium]